MVIKNIKIVTINEVIENGYITIENEKIVKVGKENYQGNEKNVIDGKGKIAMPGFIDLHIHGSGGIDFMNCSKADFVTAAKSLYQEGVTTFLATTLTSSYESLKEVAVKVKEAKKEAPSLYGIHLEGPYINEKHKGAQNAKFIRNPDCNELKDLINESDDNIRYISLAPELENSSEFIKYAVSKNVVISAGHSDASFKDMEKAISCGLTNTTHTHNAMSGHHHRNPGIVTASMYFDSLFCEFICDGIHVCSDVLKTFFKVIGPDRFMIVTDSLMVKHSDIKNFQLYGLDCVCKDGAAYLLTGPLAGSLLTMDQGIRNMANFTNASLIDLAKISSTNAARSLHLKDRGEILEGNLADIVLLSNDLHVEEVYKLGERVF